MTIKSNISRLFFAIVTSALALSATMVSAADLPMATSVSMQVKPQSALRSPGGMLSLDVRHEGAGAQAPVSVSGAPEGTSIEVLPQSENYALVSLVFPATAAKGRYTLSVKVGSAPSVEQKIEIEIGG